MPFRSLHDDLIRKSVHFKLFGEVSPTKVERYTILEQLGAGASGTVFAAYDPSLDRRIALKLVDGGDNANALTRTLREAKSIAKISHPNVIQIYEVGIWQSRVYLALEYVDGENLETWLGKQPKIHWREVMRVFLDAGRGLAAAHAAGIVHGDFKAQNVLVSHTGTAKVADFGLARGNPKPAVPEVKQADFSKLSDALIQEQLSSAGDMTRSTIRTEHGYVLGTPAYMAPELFDGERGSPASDQYAFRVALYEAMFRHLPFRGACIAEQRTNRELEAIRKPSNTSVSELILSLIKRGLSANPNQRFTTLSELLRRLEHAAAPKAKRG